MCRTSPSIIGGIASRRSLWRCWQDRGFRLIRQRCSSSRLVPGAPGSPVFWANLGSRLLPTHQPRLASKGGTRTLRLGAPGSPVFWANLGPRTRHQARQPSTSGERQVPRLHPYAVRDLSAKRFFLGALTCHKFRELPVTFVCCPAGVSRGRRFPQLNWKHRIECPAPRRTGRGPWSLNIDIAAVKRGLLGYAK